MLQTSEAKVLAGLAGQVVMVVRAEKTPQDAVNGALSILDEGKAVNLVLNQVRSGFDSDQYGYGYGQAYGKKYDKVAKARSDGLFD
jgi:receptor protein-tyrosine kinase